MKLRRAAAAAYIAEKSGAPCAPHTLDNWASAGGGPAFTKFSRFPVYDTADLDAWIEGRTSARVRSTSELRRERQI